MAKFIFVTVPSDGERLYVPYWEPVFQQGCAELMATASVFNSLERGSSLARKLLLKRVACVFLKQGQVEDKLIGDLCADQAEQYRPSSGLQFEI